MVPESHEIMFVGSPDLRNFVSSADFRNDVKEMLKAQYEVDVLVKLDEQPEEPDASSATADETRLMLTYTRNNAGGLRDAIDFLVSKLVAHGLDATSVKGAIPRPKSDSFEESLPFFDSKLLQHAPAPLATDSPTRLNFADDVSERGSIFERLRKPGSIGSFSSFIGRKNQNNSPSTSLFKHASSNASKASLVSMESRDSGYRNPWNDSGVNLPLDENGGGLGGHLGSGWPLTTGSTTSVNSRFEQKFGFGPTVGLQPSTGGDTTPKHDTRASFDSGRPSTSSSTNGNAFYGSNNIPHPVFPTPIGTQKK